MKFTGKEKTTEGPESSCLTIAAEKIVNVHLDAMFRDLVKLGSHVEFSSSQYGIDSNTFALNDDTYFRELFLYYIETETKKRLKKCNKGRRYV